MPPDPQPIVAKIMERERRKKEIELLVYKREEEMKDKQWKEINTDIRQTSNILTLRRILS